MPILPRADSSPTSSPASPHLTLRLPTSEPAMGSVPRWSALVGRRGLLFGLLAVAIVVLIVQWSDLTLSYRLNSARNALRNGDWIGAAAIIGRSKQRGET